MSKNPFENPTPIGKGREYRIKKAMNEGNFDSYDEEQVAALLDNLRLCSEQNGVLETEVMEKFRELNFVLEGLTSPQESAKAMHYRGLQKKLRDGMESYENRIQKG